MVDENEKARPLTAAKLALAGVLAWILPGAGHIFLGLRTRGLVFLTVIALTFWSGVAIGGVRYTVDPQEKTAWFAAQVCSGGHALIATILTNIERDRAPYAVASPAYQSSETGVVYCGVAGLLNLLVVIDALARGDAAGRNAELSAVQVPRSP